MMIKPHIGLSPLYQCREDYDGFEHWANVHPHRILANIGPETSRIATERWHWVFSESSLGVQHCSLIGGIIESGAFKWAINDPGITNHYSVWSERVCARCTSCKLAQFFVSALLFVLRNTQSRSHSRHVAHCQALLRPEVLCARNAISCSCAALFDEQRYIEMTTIIHPGNPA